MTGCAGRFDRTHHLRARSLIRYHVSPRFNEHRMIPTVNLITHTVKLRPDVAINKTKHAGAQSARARACATKH